MALYLPEKRGRDQFADAAEVVAGSVSEKTAICPLGEVRIVGRNAQLKTINATLKQWNSKRWPHSPATRTRASARSPGRPAGPVSRQRPKKADPPAGDALFPLTSLPPSIIQDLSQAIRCAPR